MKKRLRQVSIRISLLFTAGIFYGLFSLYTGIRIPCIFHEITGLYCPGCGITGMCISLMQGDLLGAISSNPVLFCLSPFLLFVCADSLIRYVRTGLRTLPGWQSIGIYLAIGLLILYCLIRNLLLLLS
ncbi:MAG: DUF2752 domain-containing protein [Lachnospiraceae bacterium]|nr:DUF2752 domain-containing protein [Lachnospiraceae bacterium]